MPLKGKLVTSFYTFRNFLIFLVVGVTAYLALLIRRRRKGLAERVETGIDFRPSIGFTRLDGWASLAILLANESESNVWIEEIEIFLTELVATDQICRCDLPKSSENKPNGPTSRHAAIQPCGSYLRSSRQTTAQIFLCAIVQHSISSRERNGLTGPMVPYRLKMTGLRVAP